jgi:hypothetical protein
MKRALNFGMLNGTRQEEKSLNKINDELKDELKLLDGHHDCINYNIKRQNNYNSNTIRKKEDKGLCPTL